MKLLLDENLSPRLVGRLRSLFAGLLHVRDAGLASADDALIWEWAKANEFAIVTTDSDFVMTSRQFGSPPKVIHLERCDVPLRAIEELLRRDAVRIAEFHKSSKSLLSLRFTRVPANERWRVRSC